MNRAAVAARRSPGGLHGKVRGRRNNGSVFRSSHQAVSGLPLPTTMTLPKKPAANPLDRFSQAIGHSRYIVLVAVAAVMLVAVSLFLLGAIQAFISVWHAWEAVVRIERESTQLTLQFLEVVSVMLKAVVFYIIGVGLYSLFVAPLNITVSLGVQTLSDLESKVISVVVVILGVTFLEHFVQWQDPLATLQFGAAMAVVIVALVFFQRHNHQAKEEQRQHHPNEQAKAQQHMFDHKNEKAEIVPPEQRD